MKRPWNLGRAFEVVGGTLCLALLLCVVAVAVAFVLDGFGVTDFTVNDHCTSSYPELRGDQCPPRADGRVTVPLTPHYDTTPYWRHRAH